MKVGFFGTPYLAKKVLEDLLESQNIQVSFVVAGPDKPTGRGMEIKYNPVKELAIEKKLPLYQPERIRNNEIFLNGINKFEVDYFIVVAYGKILPTQILEMPKKMCINVHGSILPKYRGASPIQSSLINGDKKTGVTIMKMSEGMDEGDILDILEIDIDKFETSETLFQKFSNVSGKFLVDTLDKLDRGLIVPIAQDSNLATYCKKISKEDGLTDFNKTSKELFNLWKGLTPWPGLFTFFNGKKLIIEECDWDQELRIENGEYRVGEVIKTYGNVGVICGDGGLLILKKVKLEGKRSQDIKDFVNGYKDFIGYKL